MEVYYVRGRRVEERHVDGTRCFFNLTRRDRAPLPGKRLPSQSEMFSAMRPVPKNKNLQVSAPASLTIGMWVWHHHSPKTLFWPSGRHLAGRVVWFHAKEEVAWTRGGPVVETLLVQYAADRHTEELTRHRDEPASTWRAAKGFAVRLLHGLVAARAPAGDGAVSGAVDDTPANKKKKKSKRIAGTRTAAGATPQGKEEAKGSQKRKGGLKKRKRGVTS